MSNSKRKLAIITGLIIVLAALVCMSMPLAFAQSGATIVGQVTVNGNATDGVLVTCGSGSNTTFTYEGTPGYYFIGGLPYNTTLPFEASYQGDSYTDTVDALSSDQQYYQIPTVNIQVSAPTVTPTPVPNVTATPVPNATITPTPEPNATATPTPEPNATVTPVPNATVAPESVSVTPSPEPTLPPATPEPTTVIATPLPATPVPEVATPTMGPTLAPTQEPVLSTPTATAPSPTQTKSPGFEGLLALSCMLGAAYLILRKGR